MQASNVLFGIINISCGIVFILLSIPLVAKKIPMNGLYGFRISKSFTSDENWYKINAYGGKQLIRWSSLLICIGILYFIFPIRNPQNDALGSVFATAPIIICTTVAIVKTFIFSKGLS